MSFLLCGQGVICLEERASDGICRLAHGGTFPNLWARPFVTEDGAFVVTAFFDATDEWWPTDDEIREALEATP